MRREAIVHRRGKTVPIDGQRRAARHARRVRRLEDHRAEEAHLGLEEPMRVRRLRALERVRADELREPIGLVRGGRANRPHLVHDDVMAALRELPRGFAACETTSDDMYGLRHSGLTLEVLGARSLM